MLALTNEQKEFRDIVYKFVKKEVEPTAQACDIEGKLNMDAYHKAVEIGLNALAWPEALGGSGLDGVTQCVIGEALHYGDAGFANALAGSTLASRPILIAGTEEQKRFAADTVIPGGFAAFCLTEANAGSDTAAIRTRAVKNGDSYIINGTKSFITNGPQADFYVVFAVTDPSMGARGISAFIVERNTPGVSVGKEEDKMGIRQSSASEVIFEDARVPASSLLGAEGKGFKIAMQTLNYGRIDAGAGAVGIAQKALDLSVRYAKERVTFGRPIGQHQAIQFILADMEIQIEAARALVWQAAAQTSAGQVSPSLCACAKTFASDMAMRVTTDAVQIYSAFGYSREYPVEKLMRDAKIFQIFEGTNQIQRMIIGGALLK